MLGGLSRTYNSTISTTRECSTCSGRTGGRPAVSTQVLKGFWLTWGCCSTCILRYVQVVGALARPAGHSSPAQLAVSAGDYNDWASGWRGQCSLAKASWLLMQPGRKLHCLGICSNLAATSSWWPLMCFCGVHNVMAMQVSNHSAPAISHQRQAQQPPPSHIRLCLLVQAAAGVCAGQGDGTAGVQPSCSNAKPDCADPCCLSPGPDSW